MRTEPDFVNLSRSPGIDSQPDYIGLLNRSLESILGLLKRLLIRAQDSDTREAIS